MPLTRGDQRVYETGASINFSSYLLQIKHCEESHNFRRWILKLSEACLESRSLLSFLSFTGLTLHKPSCNLPVGPLHAAKPGLCLRSRHKAVGFIRAIHASAEALQASGPHSERFSVPSPMLVFILIRQEKVRVKGHRNNSNNEHFCGRQGGAWSPCPGNMAAPGISTKQDKIKEVIPGRRHGPARSLQEAVSRQRGRKANIKKPGREGNWARLQPGSKIGCVCAGPDSKAQSQRTEWKRQPVSLEGSG